MRLEWKVLEDSECMLRVQLVHRSRMYALSSQVRRKYNLVNMAEMSRRDSRGIPLHTAAIASANLPRMKKNRRVTQLIEWALTQLLSDLELLARVGA